MPKLDFLNLQPFDPTRQRGPAAAKVEKKPKRLSRRKPERRKDDDEYNRIVDLYAAQNPACVYCGATESLTGDHIVSGTAGRSASLLYFDTINVACLDCNCNASLSRAQKSAAKVVTVLQTIERLQRRNFGEEETKQILSLLQNRKAGYSR